MANIPLYKQTGEKAGTIDLNSALFDVDVNSALLHEAVVSQQASARVTLAHTKDRSDVRGGGRKPWKQKGTGRARHGSKNSPIWRGGGVTFGPTNLRNFIVRMNRKARRKALAMVLSDAVKNDSLIAVDSLVFPEFKTRVLKEMLNKLPNAGHDTLILVEEKNTGIGVAANNVQNTSVLPAHCLNVVDLIKARRIIASKEALEIIESLYGKKK